MEESRIQEIRSAVGRFRKAIERSDLSSDEFYLKTFPRVCCKPASLILGKYLVDTFNCRPVEFVSAQGWDTTGSLPAHTSGWNTRVSSSISSQISIQRLSSL
jgi:hypothetical protein